jgi:hypothetical protein
VRPKGPRESLHQAATKAPKSALPNSYRRRRCRVLGHRRSSRGGGATPTLVEKPNRRNTSTSTRSECRKEPHQVDHVGVVVGWRLALSQGRGHGARHRSAYHIPNLYITQRREAALLESSIHDRAQGISCKCELDSPSNAQRTVTGLTLVDPTPNQPETQVRCHMLRGHWDAGGRPAPPSTDKKGV